MHFRCDFVLLTCKMTLLVGFDCDTWQYHPDALDNVGKYTNMSSYGAEQGHSE